METWTACPECQTPAGFPEIIFQGSGRWSMEQVCPGCGHIGPNLHFTAETEEEKPSHEKPTHAAGNNLPELRSRQAGNAHQENRVPSRLQPAGKLQPAMRARVPEVSEVPRQEDLF